MVISCHDLGKACPGFQCKWQGARELLSKCGLQLPPGVEKQVNHGYVGQVVLGAFLQAVNGGQKSQRLGGVCVGA